MFKCSHFEGVETGGIAIQTLKEAEKVLGLCITALSLWELLMGACTDSSPQEASMVLYQYMAL